MLLYLFIVNRQHTKMYIILQFSMVWFFLMDISDGRQIFVSKENSSQNTKDCGNIKKPCRHFTYALQTLSFENDIILLDNKKPYHYYLNKDVYIRGNVAITTIYSNMSSAIVFASHSIFIKALYYDTFLSINNIAFYRFDAVNDQEIIKPMVSIKAQINETELTQFRLQLQSQLQVHVNITKCFFRGFYAVLKSNVQPRELRNLDITFDNCTFVRANVILSGYFGAVYTNIIVTNSIFKDIEYSFSVDFPSPFDEENCPKRKGNFIIIEHTNFYLTKYFSIKGCIAVRIENCEFIESHGMVQYAKYVHITNTNIYRSYFTTYKHGVLTFIRNGDVYIHNTSFINTTASTTLFVEGPFLLNDCVFNNNFGTKTGSVIQHSKINDQATTSSELYNVTIHSDISNSKQYKSIINSDGTVKMSMVSIILISSHKRSTNSHSIAVLRTNFASGCIIFNLSLGCPIGFNAVSQGLSKKYLIDMTSLSCQQCKGESYSLEKSNSRFDTVYYKYHKWIKIKNKKNNFKCQDCPTGGKCQTGIISKDNFWGFVYHKDQVKFLPCPNSYCCSKNTQACISYNTCSFNRQGTLCGTCNNISHLSYFDNKCRENISCKQWLFWLLTIFYTITYTIIIMYLHDITHFSKRCFYKIKSITMSFSIKKFSKTNKTTSRSELLVPLISNNENEYEGVEDETTEELQFLSQEENKENEEEFGSFNEEVKNEDLDNLNLETKQNRKNNNFLKTFTGLEKIVFFFYQIKSLLDVTSSRKLDYGFLHSVKHIIIELFNFHIIATKLSTLCPYNNLQPLGKENIKVSLFLFMFVLLIIFTVILKIFTHLKKYFSSLKQENVDQAINVEQSDGLMKTFYLRIKICALHLMLLTYTGISTYSFKMLNCVEMNGRLHMYIYGDFICFCWWQYLLIIFSIIWIAPFGFTVYISTKLLQEKRIRIKQFYLCLLFPPLCVYYYFNNRKPLFDLLIDHVEQESITNLFEGPFREECSHWQMVILFRRFILSVVAAFIIDPVYKLFVTFPILLLCIAHSGFKQPYQGKNVNFAEQISLLILMLLNLVDVFWAYDYSMDMSTLPGFYTLSTTFALLEDIIVVMPVLLIVITLFRITLKALIRFIKNRRKVD